MEGRFITSRSFLIIFEFVYVFTCLCSEEAPKGDHISRCPLKVGTINGISFCTVVGATVAFFVQLRSVEDYWRKQRSECLQSEYRFTSTDCIQCLYGYNVRYNGDTLTPNEMISLAAKLLQQDEKGVITLSNSPKTLAEELFQLLFKRSQHVVILTDFDIFHLDILQAIPIMGDDSDTDIKQEIVDTIAYEPKDNGINEPRSCSFNLISKDCNERNEYPKFRRGLKIAEKLRKKRRLVVNNNRRNFNSSGKSSDIRASVEQQVQKLLQLRNEHLKEPNMYYNQTRRLESLGEYFDNILHHKEKQKGDLTTANTLNQSEDETKESGSEELKKQLDQPEIEVQVEINEENDDTDSTKDGRRILGIPTIPTTKAK